MKTEVRAVITFPADMKPGLLASSGFYATPTNPDDTTKPYFVYGATVAADKANAFGAFCDSMRRSSQQDALGAVLCGNWSTGTSTPAVAALVQDLWKQLSGHYRGAMGTKAASYSFAALKTVWGEALKEARGGEPANFALALRNLADAIDAGKDIVTTNCVTGKVPKDH